MKAMTLLIFITVTLCLILQGCSSTTNDTVEPVKPTSDNTINSNTPLKTTEIPVQPSPNKYQITVVVHPSGAGVVTTEPPEDTVNAGTEVTFLTTPGIGFSFDYWLVDGQVSENITSIILNSNKVIDAYFLPNVEKITGPVVKDYIDKQNEIVLVDVRPLGDYEKDHIPGAISIPSDEIKSRWNEIPPDKIVFVYASCIK